MNLISQHLLNPVLAKAVIAWFVSCTLKLVVVLFEKKRMDWRRFFGNGGMPSSHTTFVVALATGTGLLHGFDGPHFAIAFAIAMVVMADAAGVRQAVGRQAQVLNEITRLLHGNQILKVLPDKFIELIGHTRLEVVCGALLGIAGGLVL